MWTLFCTLSALAALQEPAGVGQSLTHLTELQSTEHFQIRYRPGSQAGASVDQLARQIELTLGSAAPQIEALGRELGSRGQTP